MQTIAESAPMLCARQVSVPISEQGIVRIGGIEQWIAVSNDDAANPILLSLHGGRGAT